MAESDKSEPGMSMMALVADDKPGMSITDESSEDEPEKSTVTESPLKLVRVQPHKKPKLSINVTKCIICQTATQEKLTTAGKVGVESLKFASNIRGDSIVEDLFDHMVDSVNPVVYHRSYYQSYTSNTNLRSFTEEKNLKQPVPEPKQTRSRTPKMLDWSRCFLCHSRKRDRLHKVLTETRQLTLKKAAEARNDHDMLGFLEGEDLLAKNAVYHGNCMASSISQHNISGVQFREDTPIIEDAFAALILEIDSDLKCGKAFRMKDLLLKLQHYLGSNTNEAKTYTFTSLPWPYRLLCTPVAY